METDSGFPGREPAGTQESVAQEAPSMGSARVTSDVQVAPIQDETRATAYGETVTETNPGSMANEAPLCQYCRTSGHESLGCSFAHTIVQERSLQEVGQLFLVGRINKPQLATVNYLFYDILELLVGYDDLPAEERTKPRKWPWSLDFAIAVRDSRPGDEILGGKLHPSEFDFSRHAAHDLPENPFFRGKSYADIIRMREEGEFDFNPNMKYKGVIDFVLAACLDLSASTTSSRTWLPSLS